MAISYVSSAQAATTTVSISTHEQGDFIFGVAIANGTTPPDMPTGQNWTLNSSAGGIINSGTSFWKFADSSSESFGTATGANQVLVYVLKGVNRSDPIGAFTANGGFNVNFYRFYELSFEETNGSSWLMGYGYTETGSPNFGTISGTTQRLEAGRVVIADTNAGVTGWPSDVDGSLDANYDAQSAVFEIKAQPYSGGFFSFM